MQTILSINLIASDPTIRSGRPVIAGTSIEISDIVCALRREPEPRTLEQIAASYALSPAQVYAAMAFYYEHQVDIDMAIQANDAAIETAKAKRIERLN